MSLIYNGTTIPTSGNVKYGSTNLTTINCNTAQIWKKVTFTSKTFSYTGAMQACEVPPGLYKLEVWGAAGACARRSTYYPNGWSEEDYGTWAGPFTLYSGYGGYSVLYYEFFSTTTLYIGCGQAGPAYPMNRYRNSVYNVFNGGGGLTDVSIGANDEDSDSYVTLYMGGGCSHIATSPGQLYTLENNKSSVLVVAGGGGGSGCTYSEGMGGHGGGTTGGRGFGGFRNNFQQGATEGGTQTGGGAGSYFGRAESAYLYYGYIYPTAESNSTGGGGWYGGGYGGNYNGSSPSSGGSGYIKSSSTKYYNGTAYTSSTNGGGSNYSPGYNDGAGYAKITFIG